MLGLFEKERELTVDEPDAEEMPWGTGVAIEERYRPLVEKLERHAAADPKGYRRRVMLAAALGYAVVLTLLLFMLTMVGGLLYLMISQGHPTFIGLKLLFVTGIISWAILGSLWVRTEAPDGLRLEPTEAPALFALVERLRSRIGGPHIDELLITDQFNAAIVQRPRFGIFGGYRNYLVLGLPLLQGLSEAEASSVIAHELGHFAGNHGRFAISIYRVRATWAQLSMRLREGRSANLLRRFFAWYGPWFNAYSFALARADEYEADRVAASATSPETAASGLLRSNIQGRRTNRHWHDLWDQARLSPRPPQLPFAGMASFLASRPEGAEVEQSLGEALQIETGLEDTHPSLADRLSALGVSPAPPSPFDRSAAQSLLGPLEGELVSRLDKLWWERASEAWKATNEEWNALQAELAALNQASATRTLNREERFRQAELTGLFQGDEAALRLYQAAADADPEDLPALYRALVTRLSLGDAHAAAELNEFAVRQPPFAILAHEELVSYHLGKGEIEAAERAHEKYAEARASDEKREAEFRSLKESDSVDPLSFEDSQLASIRSALSKVDGLIAVYAAARTLQTNGERQLILLVEMKDLAMGEAVLEEVGKILADGKSYLGFALGSETRWLKKKLVKIEGTRIYP